MNSSSRLALASVIVAAPLATLPPAMAQKANTANEPTHPKAQKSKSTYACKGLSDSEPTANRLCGWVKPKKRGASNRRKLTAECDKAALKQ